MSIRDRSPIKRNIKTNNSLSYQDIQISFNFAKHTVSEYHGSSKNLCYFLAQAEKFKNNIIFTVLQYLTNIFYYIPNKRGSS